MLCNICENLLDKISTPDGLKLECGACGLLFDASPDDSLVYIKDDTVATFEHKGSTIWNYPANQKIMGECPDKDCRAQVIAWQSDNSGEKIYGCRCGIAFKRSK